MGRKRTCDQNAVLDAFAQKLPLAQISRSMGIPIGTLGAIIHRARKAGDPRAALRRRLRHLTVRPIVKVEAARPLSARRRRQQLAREFPASADELNAAVARANVDVRRLPPGIASCGWRPSWLKI